jgi:CRISPR-associated protein Cas2
VIVVIVENAPRALRGRLSLWLVEIRAGVYVGRASQRQRLAIRTQVICGLRSGSATILWSRPTDSGFDLELIGDNRRRPIDIEGAKLVSFWPES